ncbi:MAG TPA: tetratricopeptide repeat protein [Rhizomicrobium sp.]|jgi:TPR repeat protein|nr:tetratricopeptide repeat protein [Rhizomicrobium sp.]
MIRTVAAITALFICGSAGAALAQDDTSITITATHTACQVAPPADVPAPVTPSAAAGGAAMQNHNYALARANFKALADNGNVEGQRLYGALLMVNCTGIQDKEEGAKWLQKAADAGDVPAETQLANAYMNGNGLAQDDTKAFALLTKAANAGNALAQINLGYLYLNGRGAPMDKYQGMVWTVKAGEQGFAVALFNIANAYFKGKALPQDNDKAAYYMFTAFGRSTPAQHNRFASAINEINQGMSADALKHQAERARRWSPGPGSLSDVLDDAKERQKTAQN